MKNSKINLFVAMAAMAFSACQNDDVKPVNEGDNALPTEMATVQFNMKAAAMTTPGSRATAQVYNTDGLRILAFRQSEGGAYLYLKDVDKGNIAYSDGNFSGTAQLPVGNYQFIPAYGLPEPTSTDVTIPQPGTTTDITSVMNITHNTGVLPAIFLQENGKTPDSYTLGVNNNEKTDVELALKRAVARVDVIFVRGTKNATTGKYEEKPDGNSVLGVGLDSMGMSFTNITPTVQLMDGAIVDNQTAIQPSFTQNVTEGKGLVLGTNADSTTLGTPDGINAFENVQPSEIAKGGAFIYGPFVFPYKDKNTTTTLTIKVKSKESPDNQISRRTIVVKNVKLLRNQVTLVKVYVPGDDLFHTEGTFAVTINRDWEYNVNEEGEAN